MKPVVYLALGLCMLALAACGSASAQTPTSVIRQTPDKEGLTPGTGPPSQDVQTATVGIPVTGEDLVNTKWRLISFGEHGAETPAIETAQPTLEFEELGHVAGFGGCNTFSTQYILQDDTITFDTITSTEIACTEQGVNEQEQRYFQTLQAANQFEHTKDGLVIHSSDETNVLNFVSIGDQAAPTPISNLLCSIIDEGSKSGWSLCRSQEFGFEVQYPPSADLIDHTSTSIRINLPFPTEVNLTEKYVTLSATEESGVCTSPLVEGRPAGSFSRAPVQINGLEFIKEAGQEAATGSVYNWEAYSIRRNTQCISLGFVLRSFQPELKPTPPPRFDMERESEIFTEIVSTFKWLEAPTESTPSPERIEFSPGATSATVTGELQASGSYAYVLRAIEGQTMRVDITFTYGEAILVIWGADGTVLLSDHAEASSFRRALPSTQDYFILVKGRPEGSTSYIMTVTISALTTEPERIEFAPGATSTTLTGQLQASGSEQYVLRAFHGQILSVDLTFAQGAAILAVWGADGTVLLSDHAEVSTFDGVLPWTQDYYLLVISRPEGNTTYSMTVRLPPLP